MNCNETFLSEVTHVELVTAASCSIPVPPNAIALTELAGCTVGTPSLVVDTTDDDSYTGLMESAPTLKPSMKAQAGGRIRQHDLSVPVRINNKVRQAVDALQGVDFHVVLRTQDGTRYLLYSLPGSPAVSIDGQFGGADPKMTLKVSLQSLSGMIQMK